MKMTKRIIAAFVCLYMVLTLLPGTASAVVNGTYTMDFTLTNATWGGLHNVNLTTTNASNASHGWAWEANTKILTLSGLEYVTTAATAIKLPAGAVLSLEGTNSVTANGSGSDYSIAGIYVGGDFNMVGPGSLTVRGGSTTRTAGNCCGVYCIDGNIKVYSGELDAYAAAYTATANGDSFGVYAEQYNDSTKGNIAVMGGELCGTGGSAPGISAGVVADSGIEVSGGGTLYGEGGGAVQSYGVQANSRITVSGTGTFTGIGGAAAGDADNSMSYGVYTGGFTIQNGTVTATGGQAIGAAQNDSYGMYGAADLSVSGGTVTAKGNRSTSNSIGIVFDSTSFSGGTTVAQGNNYALEYPFPTLTNVAAVGNTNYDGGYGDETFTDTRMFNYKYFSAYGVPTVTGVTVSPATASVPKGGTKQFSATVTGTNNPAQTVTWSVSGNTSNNTDISASGLLTVGSDETETASASVIVKATSTVDPTVSGTAGVKVDPAPCVINVSASPVAGGTATGGGTYPNGQGVTVTATANTDYRFVKWTENGGDVSANANYTFAATANRTLVAVFEAVVNPPASDNTITGVTAGQSFTLGDTVTFTATGGGMSNRTPQNGDYRFLPSNWASNPSGNFNSGYTQSFSTTGMSLGSHTLTVTFSKQRFNGTAWATLSPAVTDQKSVSYMLVAGGGAPAVTPPDTASDRTVTVIVGNTATLSITATGAISYQWYKSMDGGRSFTPIAGARSASYTTSPVTIANDGYRYYCVAANDVGSARSCVFVLNVIKEPHIPATGDNMRPILWLSLLLMAGVAFAISAALYRRKRKMGE